MTPLDRALDEQGFSGVVSIRREDTILYERAAGLADRSNGVPNMLQTRFGIASGTKLLTALAVGLLVAEGRLAFETKLADCVDLPFPRYSPEITLRHLLTHTSGIPDYFDEEKITDFDDFHLAIPWFRLRGPRDYLPLFPDEPMRFAPGERFAYSNGGYLLLGVVIETLSGTPYQTFVEERIFRALGMDRSGFFALDRLPLETAQGYIEDGDGWRTNVYNLPVVGASDGGAFTTAGDLAILWKALWSGALLPPEMVDLYARPHIAAGHRAYGHGLWIDSPWEYITGSDAGVSFRSAVDRRRGLLATVLSNTSHGAWPAWRAVLAALEE